MAYNHSNQYRFTIIRGKAKNEIDNLLPLYAEIIEKYSPASKVEFDHNFNEGLKRYFPGVLKKTLDNHRTEIAYKLFGMYWIDENNIVRISERASKLLLDNDQPAFFKDICSKIQYPSGADNQFSSGVQQAIRLVPCAYVLKLMLLAEDNKMRLTKDEIGYYALNNLDVLRGEAQPEEVLLEISTARKAGISRKIPLQGHASSWATQHIRELLNYLELANLITETNQLYVLNHREDRAINFIVSKLNNDYELPFNIYAYDLSSVEGRRTMQLDWSRYFGLVATNTNVFETSITALGIDSEILTNDQSLGYGLANHEIGNEGELFVYQYEKKRVTSLFPYLANKVLLLSAQKGIGYDIQSVFAEGMAPDKYMQIEVKATKRVTQAIGDFWDTVTMTRSEWVAAEQYLSTYFIYRVYFTQAGTKLFVINNPASQQGPNLRAQPLEYRVEFNEKTGNFLPEE